MHSRIGVNRVCQRVTKRLNCTTMVKDALVAGRCFFFFLPAAHIYVLGGLESWLTYSQDRLPPKKKEGAVGHNTQHLCRVGVRGGYWRGQA